jgi:Cellulase (glycosyl hydrolase family 5)
MPPMSRYLACLALVVAVLSSPAAAADRMWMGFTDDPSLRFAEDRQTKLDRVAASRATVVRTLVRWNVIAPTKPADATDPFDPAYAFDDLDELVRNAQARGLEVEMALWGTPGWANGDQVPQIAPTDTNDFRAFAQAVATRYSGRFPGYPFVRFYGIWNESNLATFLRPQFDAGGRIVSPAIYARLAIAGYAGIKTGNPLALVAVGETSSNGRNRHVPGLTDTVAPGTFVQLMAKAAPRLRFDAWAQHPYPFPVNQAPAQVSRWPNVTLSLLPRLGLELDRSFRRKNIPIWITEYGNETKPGEPKGVTEAQQARYLPQAIALARKDPRVKMFIWFVFRDSPTSTWQSGLYRLNGSAKPAARAWRLAAAPLDARNATISARAGTVGPWATVYLRDFCANNPTGAAVGSTTRVRNGGHLVGVTQAQLELGLDCAVRVQLPITVKLGVRYEATIDLNATTGNTVQRTITLVGT